MFYSHSLPCVSSHLWPLCQFFVGGRCFPCLKQRRECCRWLGTGVSPEPTRMTGVTATVRQLVCEWRVFQNLPVRVNVRAGGGCSQWATTFFLVARELYFSSFAHAQHVDNYFQFLFIRVGKLHVTILFLFTKEVQRTLWKTPFMTSRANQLPIVEFRP